MSVIEAQNISFSDNGKEIINNISFKVEEKDYISIVGPSGSGKSTVLKLIAHLISPDQGTLYFKGKEFTKYSPYDLRKNVSYCFQTPKLFGNTVMDNINFPFSIRHKNIDLNRVNTLLNTFGFDNSILDKSIVNLSGGEKQRIALIRNLIFKPDVLLLDEVTSALDNDNTLIVEKVIKKLNKEGITILWVTHNVEQSLRNANKIMTIEYGKIKSLEVLK